jgi:glutaredoxin-like YruB-family protein
MAVSIYSTPTCTYCRQLKDYLRERGVRFVDYDVSRDERKAGEMLHKSRQTGVPVLDFNGTVIVGFDKQRIDRLIARSR